VAIGARSSGSRLDIQTADVMTHLLPSPARQRAPRYPVRTDVRYRQVGERDWHDGRTENISRNGVLIRTRHMIARHVPIEVLLALPPELGGAPGIPVMGRGRVVRTEPPSDAGAEAAVAAFIAEYIPTYVPGDDPRRI
jgi:hypothetical protein